MFIISLISPYFQRIFCETPCKHPVIVLKDLKGWEMQAIVDFMYKGEISVGHEQLASLINAAESLQVWMCLYNINDAYVPTVKSIFNYFLVLG